MSYLLTYKHPAGVSFYLHATKHEAYKNAYECYVEHRQQCGDWGAEEQDVGIQKYAKAENYGTALWIALGNIEGYIGENPLSIVELNDTKGRGKDGNSYWDTDKVTFFNELNTHIYKD